MLDKYLKRNKLDFLIEHETEAIIKKGKYFNKWVHKKYYLSLRKINQPIKISSVIHLVELNSLKWQLYKIGNGLHNHVLSSPFIDLHIQSQFLEEDGYNPKNLNHIIEARVDIHDNNKYLIIIVLSTIINLIFVVHFIINNFKI